GKFVKTESADLIEMIGAKRSAYAESVAELPSYGQSMWGPIAAGEPYKRVQDLENKILSDAKVNAPLPIDIAAWRDAYDKLFDQLRTFDLDFGATITTNATPVAYGIIGRLAAAAILGLLAVLASILLSIRIGRSLIRRLTGLRHDAQNLADV